MVNLARIWRLGPLAPAPALGQKADLSTDRGRAAEREKRIALGAMAAAVAKIVTVLTGLITVPLTLHYLGTERYGMWMTISSLAAFLSFADLGLGNGLMNSIALAHGRDQANEIVALVSSGIIALGLVGLILGTLVWLTMPLVNWAGVFAVHSPQARSEAGYAAAVFVTCFAVGMPLSVIQRVLVGLQMGFVASLWQCVAGVAGLIAVLVAVHLEASLPWLVAAIVGTPLAITALSGVVFFLKTRPDLMPHPRLASLAHAKEISHIGILFFVLQIVVALTYFSDNVIIAQKLGASAVASYAVADKLFAMISFVVGFAVTPLWPALTEALARGDLVWARRTHRRVTLIAFGVSSCFALMFAVFGPHILQLWVRGSVHPPLALLFGLAMWRVIEATASPSSMYLNALRAIPFQIAVAVATCIATLVFKLELIGTYGLWVAPYITGSCYIVFAGIPMALFLRRKNKMLQ